MAAIEIEGLSKQYGKGMETTPALSELNLTVNEGEVLALLGANGAGKSTLLRILSTLLSPDHGYAAVGGFDVVRQAARVRESIGISLQEASLYPAGRVSQILDFHARLHGYNRAEAATRSNGLIELMNLAGVTNQKVHRLSGGMRRRLDLSLALIHQPPVLLLDEPTTSLDLSSKQGFWRELSRRSDQGTCVLLATQDLNEAEQLANRVVVLVDGSIWLDDTPAIAWHETSADVRSA